MKTNKKSYAKNGSKTNNDDILLNCASDMILEEDIKNFEEASEKYKHIKCSDEKKEAMFADIMKRAKKESFNYKIKRATKIAAILVLAIGIFGIGGLYSTSEAFRVHILDVIFHSHDKYDELEAINREYPGEENNDWNNDGVRNTNEQFVLQFGYIPNGYKLEQNNSHSLIYIKDECTYISLNHRSGSSLPQINNENISSERIYRNGCEIELRSDGTYYFAVWQYKDMFLTLYAINMDKDTFLQVFDGLYEVKDK